MSFGFDVELIRNIEQQIPFNKFLPHYILLYRIFEYIYISYHPLISEEIHTLSWGIECSVIKLILLE